MLDRSRLPRLIAIAAAMGVALTLSGCSADTFPILHPGGPVTQQERDILFRTVAIMMIVVVPVFVMAFWFAWRYRAGNAKARYDRNWMSTRIDIFIWTVPALIVLALAVNVWISTRSLDPYKPLDPSVQPLVVEVVALDWNWLFIYPEQHIAAVNELAFPSGVPLTLKITSDTAMNSFSIPALGGQIYAMAGMQTQLNLLADQPGTFTGRNTQYTGDGFPDQHFQAIAMSSQDFAAWVANARQSTQTLDQATYQQLAAPSRSYPVTTFADVAPHFFDDIIQKYAGTAPAASQ